MNKEEMEMLADLVVTKLISKQKELDSEFIENLKASNIPLEVHQNPSIKDKMIMEITKLNIMLKEFEKSEDYESAGKCSERIYYLKNEISKLNQNG
jgi:hypothetical protein